MVGRLDRPTKNERDHSVGLSDALGQEFFDCTLRRVGMSRRS